MASPSQENRMHALIAADNTCPVLTGLRDASTSKCIAGHTVHASCDDWVAALRSPEQWGVAVLDSALLAGMKEVRATIARAYKARPAVPLLLLLDDELTATEAMALAHLGLYDLCGRSDFARFSTLLGQLCNYTADAPTPAGTRTVADYALLAFAETDIGLLVATPAGHILCANPAADSLFCQGKGSLQGQSLPVHPAPCETVKHRFKAGGTDHVIELSAQPQSFQGEDVYVIAVRDVTSQENAHRVQHLLATAIDHTTEGVVLTDTHGVIQYANRAFLDITGYELPELLNHDASMLASTRHSERFFYRMFEHLRKGETWTGDLLNRHKDGNDYELRMSISPIADSQGVITHYIALCQDVTKEKECQQRLQQSQKLEAMGTLACGIAHDFNNSLSIINGYTQLVAAALDPDSKQCQDLEQVLNAANRAGDLVRQVLTFSREEEDFTKPLRLDIVVKEVGRFLEMAFPATIEFTYDNIMRDAIIKGDATQLHQVVINLCTNARDAMAENGGALDVALEEVTEREVAAAGIHGAAEGPYYRLTISDTGPGMAPEVVDHIFEPFYTTKSWAKGTGLGLWNVEKFVTHHGGAIHCESTPGVGTTFRVFFPVHRQPSAKPSSAGSQIAPTGNGERLLVVDDEERILHILERMLGSLKYDVTACMDPREALALFQRDPNAFDLLVTDEVMPHLIGSELARQARALHPDLPILLITGYSDRLTAQRVQRIGIDRVLIKPLNKHELAQTVSVLLTQNSVNNPTP
ncbi:MAG: ATP-binding protein [Candidatus Hydrogenedentota bacterium]